MMRRYGLGVLMGCLILMTLGAVGIVLMNSSLFRVRSFVITIDDDSLRTGPLVDLLEGLHDKHYFSITTDTIHDSIAELQQVDRVAVVKRILGKIRIDIATRKPILMITNANTAICLSPDGIPFPYWPEHGDLPVFNVPDFFTQDQLLSPDINLQNYYAIARQINDLPVARLRQYSHLIASDSFYLTLLDPESKNRLRLLCGLSKNTSQSLVRIDHWLRDHHPITIPCEYDARFGGIIVIRPIQEGYKRG